MSKKTYNDNLLTVRAPQSILDNIAKITEQTGMTKTEVVVDMLNNSLPSLHIQDRNKLPESAGVYLVYTSDNKLLYIGQTDNLKYRWATHEKFGKFLEADLDCRVSWFALGDVFEIEPDLLNTAVNNENNSEYNSVQSTEIHEIKKYVESELTELREMIQSLKKDNPSYHAVR